MDERIVKILKAVAYENVEEADYGGGWCYYCHSRTENQDRRFDGIEHEPECEMVLARTILRECGTSFYGYQVTYVSRHHLDLRGDYATPITIYIAAFSRDEARTQIPGQGGIYTYHNIEIEQVKEL